MNSSEVMIGDCIEVMKIIRDESIDAIVTDPPYGIGFMSKDWDKTPSPLSFQLWCQEWAEQALRVLKPGGYMLAFGGTRMYHRMASGVEDAGFEIRDCIQWLYGSGFPKNHNIAKAIEKKSGDAKRFEGWGTALKPACEIIVMARKPLIGSVADNMLEYGTGGLNIEASRIGSEVRFNPSYTYYMVLGDESTNPRRAMGDGWRDNHPGSHATGRWPANVIFDEAAGKILDEQSGETKSRKGKERGTVKKGMFANGDFNKVGAEYNDSGGASRFFYCAKASKKEREAGLQDREAQMVNDGREIPADKHYQRESTERLNIHPTVKPIKLMEHLVKMVTPESGTVLDPFTGSGSTGIAAVKNGFHFIGIEKEEEYAKIACSRMNHAIDYTKGIIE